MELVNKRGYRKIQYLTVPTISGFGFRDNVKLNNDVYQN